MKKGIIISSVLVLIGIAIAYKMNMDYFNQKVLPVIQPNDVKSEMVNPEIANKGIGHRIGDFAFQDQMGNTITLDDVKGKVFVAEYFFTTCQTICPIMTDEMKRVQDSYRGNPNVKILSFTVDPETDNVAVMKAYAEKHNAAYGQWYFLTGEKKDLYQLARNSFFVLKPAEARNLGDAGSDFIHTNNFVLVDQQLRIRGYYDGTNAKEVDTLIQDISLLLAQE